MKEVCVCQDTTPTQYVYQNCQNLNKCTDKVLHGPLLMCSTISTNVLSVVIASFYQLSRYQYLSQKQAVKAQTSLHRYTV